MADTISDATQTLLDAARALFNLPDAPASRFRISVSPDGERLEFMLAGSAPLMWHSVSIKLREPGAAKVEK